MPSMSESNSTPAGASSQTTASNQDVPQQQQQNTKKPVFSAHLDNAKLMANLIRAISTQQRATCYLSNKGIKFSTEDSRTVQAHAYLQKSIFRDFDLQRDTSFGVNLEVFVSCLNIFGTSTKKEAPNVSLNLLYSDDDETLQLVLQDDDVVTSCRLRTYEPATPIDFAFRDSPVANKVIIKSAWLKEAFDEMDSTSECVNFLVTPTAPYFRIHTVGLAGSAEMDYPKNADVIETFQCDQMMLQSYRQSSLNPALKALSISEKTSLRMNRRGFLSLQFLVQSADINDALFIEYFLVPVDNDNDTDAMETDPA